MTSDHSLLPTFLPYICSFRLYLHQLMVVNVKLDIKGYMRIVFQGYMLNWTRGLLMAEVKLSWQCWYSHIAESL